MRNLLIAALLATTPLVMACQARGGTAQMELSPAGLEQRALVIRSGATEHRFTVEVAATPEQQEMGLMNRTVLAPDRGMIFPFPAPRVASFWMKNTLIPLDMLFIRADGTIESIVENAVPQDLSPRMSQGEVKTVLELPGGRASALGIKPGDHVRW